jgi:hypothetical protein
MGDDTEHMGKERGMISEATYGFAEEFYVVEKTVELVITTEHNSVTIRVEALHDPRKGEFHARAYSREEFRIQPANLQTNSGCDCPGEVKSLWVNYDLPWTCRSTADDAISQALGFLRDGIRTE